MLSKKKSDTSKSKHPYVIVLKGDGAVGKSALAVQYLQHHFVKKYDPTVEDSYLQSKEIDGEPCVINVIDSAGQDCFNSLNEHQMKIGDGFLLIFSITNRNSFQMVKLLYNQIIQIHDRSSFPMLMVGNKIDLVKDRIVSEEEAVFLANELNIKYIETSAKPPAVNVDLVFLEIVRLIRHSEMISTPEQSSKDDNRKDCCEIL